MSDSLRPYSPFSRLSRRMQRAIYADTYRAIGSLYGAGYESVESANIRDELEELGLPMGYGRVGRAPSVLSDEYGDNARV